MDRYSRNKHEDSTVATTRSNRTDRYEGVSLVKVEEKSDSLQAAIEDTAKKSRWLPHYARLPFIFGIAVTAEQLQIFTLHANNTMTSVFHANLTDIVARWSCVVAAINIARTLKPFIEKRWVMRSIKFDQWHERNNKRIRLDVNFAEVEFYDRETFRRMRAFYTATSGVPHLEHFYLNPELACNDEESRVRLVPVGVERKPTTACELTIAIKHICESLFGLHALGYVHCDVRWNNIIDAFNSWFLIDCEYACRTDERGLLAARSATTIKKRFVMDASKAWSPLFDLYQVGLLLTDSAISDMGPELTELRDHLLSKKFTTATVKRAVANLQAERA